MAQRIVHQLIDDFDGTELAPGQGHTILFSLDGVSYEIDLTEANALRLRDALAPYVAAGRRVGAGSGRTRAASPTAHRAPLEEIRAWARTQGYQVADRGRIAAAIEAEFNAR